MDWQPIETAPKDGTLVLLLDNRSRCSRAAVWIEGHEHVGWMFWDGSTQYLDSPDDYNEGERFACLNWYPKNEPYTAWMPLPSAAAS